MFISVAAAALDKYQWYQYQGRKTLAFEDHNPKYDLDLEPKMKFGIRKYGGKLKLALLTEPDIVFTMTDTEVKKLLRLSKGWSGVVKGVKLKAGIGGKDTKDRATRQHDPDVQKTDKYFPDLPMPPSKADIVRLYNYFNKLHFDNECPAKFKLLFSDAMKFSGQAQVVLKSPPVFTLKLAKRAMTDRARIFSIVLHEMIHLLHYKRCYIDGNELYSNASHGPLFLEDMHKLNKFGYGINTKEFDVAKAQLAVPEHILLIELASDQTIVLHYGKDFEANVPDILDYLRARLSSSIEFVRYVYGTTENSYCFQGMRLSKNKTVTKNRKIRAFANNSTASTSLWKETKVIKEESLRSEHGDIRPLVKSAVDGAVSLFVDQSLPRYLSAILITSGLITEREASKVASSGVKDFIEVARKSMSAAELDYAQKLWSNIEDRHLLKSDHFKWLRRTILKDRLDGDDAIRYLARGYDKRSYQGRIDYQRYAKLCVESLGDIIVMPDKELEQKVIEATKKHWDGK